MPEIHRSSRDTSMSGSVAVSLDTKYEIPAHEPEQIVEIRTTGSHAVAHVFVHLDTNASEFAQAKVDLVALERERVVAEIRKYLGR